MVHTGDIEVRVSLFVPDGYIGAMARDGAPVKLSAEEQARMVACGDDQAKKFVEFMGILGGRGCIVVAKDVFDRIGAWTASP